jgi:TMEM175 potassium channel family protein
MSDHHHEPHAPETMGAGRLEAFSDAVMAVIITILALELRPPEGSTLDALRDQKGEFGIYLLAFVFIAIYWNNHHHLLRATTRINGGAMWSNMFLLFWLSLVPVITEWIRADVWAQIPVASFGVIALGAAVAYSLLVRSLIVANGKDSLLARAIAHDVKGYVSLAMYAAAIVFAAASDATVWVAYVLYVAVAVMWLIPDRRFSRAARED